MFLETSYPGYLGDLGGSAWQAALAAGFAGTKKAWKRGGGAGTPSAGGGGPALGAPASTTTIPTTEPNTCPPGMTYSPPPPGSGTGSCTGSIVPGDGSGGATSGTATSGGGISDLLGSISPTVWLIAAAVAVFVLLKK